MAITVVGLGPGSADDITRRVWQVLATAETVILRTARHLCVPELPAGPTLIACDDLYEMHAAFVDVYDAIVDRVMTAAASGDVVYAVPGDPMIGEATTAKLRAAAEQANVRLEVLPGISFIEPSLALVGVDGIDGVQIHDALTLGAMHHPQINPDYPALISQVYSAAIASDLKLTLMTSIRRVSRRTDTRCWLPACGLEHLPLFEIDRAVHFASHIAYLPALGEMSSFERFQDIIAHLRAQRAVRGIKTTQNRCVEILSRKPTKSSMPLTAKTGTASPKTRDVLLRSSCTPRSRSTRRIQMSDVLRAITVR